jgi:catalase
MDGHSINAYKFVKNKKVTYVKFNWKSLQGVKNFTVDEAAAANYKANTIDLYNAIDQQNFPSWELQIQTISPDDFDNYDYDLLDATKQWLDVPFETIGVMTLNKNPDNVFQQTEQSVFKVSNFIYGIEASEDRILQARLFVMPEASFYRVGINNHQLPINRCPFKDIHNYNQNGASNSDITTSSLNYSPSHSIEGYVANKKYLDTSDRIHGKTVQKSIKPTHNFTQAGIVFRRFSSAEQGRIITNLSNDLNNITNPIIKLYMVSYTYMADINYGTALALAANVDISTVQYFVQNYKQN